MNSNLENETSSDFPMNNRTEHCPICNLEVDMHTYHDHVESHYDGFTTLMNLFNPMNLTINPSITAFIPNRDLDNSSNDTEIHRNSIFNQLNSDSNNISPINELFEAFSTISQTFGTILQGVDAETQHTTVTTPLSSPFYATRQNSLQYLSPFFYQQMTMLNIGLDENDIINDYEANLRLAETLGVVNVGIDDIDSVGCIINKDKITEDIKCPICLECLNTCEGDVRFLICSHTFCDNCIKIWLSKHKKCPVCNIDLQDKLNEISSTNGL